MQKIIVLALSLLTVGLNAQTKKNINTDNSKIHWKAYKVGGSHEGDLQLKSGHVKFDKKGRLVSGEFVADMNTMTCTDLSGEWADKLVAHLKNEDFFNTSVHETARFVITKVNRKSTPGHYVLKGHLKIKNLRKPAWVDAIVKDNTATGTLRVDRTAYNIRYGSGKFFSNLGDRTIRDHFDLGIQLRFN